MSCHKFGFRSGLLGTMLCMSLPSGAFVIGISPAPQSLFLQVGVGSMVGGSFKSGGIPGNNSTVNSVSVMVSPASIGTGALAMLTDSTVTNSPYSGAAFCALQAQVYLGGFYRRPGRRGTATLSVSSPPSLSNGAGDTIPFNSISWLSGGIGDSSATVPSGTFAGGAQILYSAANNTWFESCLAFSYANAALVPSGVFTGRVTYTLTAP